ncbi:MAG TPA: DUF2884 family protein [Variovorax sp.]|nr:DUF2884 family protein [Variovorax sp.]
MRNRTFISARPALLAAGLLLGLAALTGCGRHDADSAAKQAAQSATADADAGKDGKSFHINGGITFNGDEVTLRRDNLPVAVITAAGDLKLDGKTVTHTDAQRQAMTAYRKEIQALTLQGIEVGKAGARLGVDAASEAIKGIFSGDADKIDARIEAKTGEIEKAARKLCEHVELLRVAQDAAVVQVPQFKPYANIDQGDVTDCRK